MISLLINQYHLSRRVGFRRPRAIVRALRACATSF